jgi:hypothetical protein
MRNWLQLALSLEIVGDAIKVAFIVGTILTAINQGDIIASGSITPSDLVKILLNYFVPYCVSTYAAVEALANEQREGNRND